MSFIRFICAIISWCLRSESDRKRLCALFAILLIILFSVISTCSEIQCNFRSTSWLRILFVIVCIYYNFLNLTSRTWRESLSMRFKCLNKFCIFYCERCIDSRSVWSILLQLWLIFLIFRNVSALFLRSLNAFFYFSQDFLLQQQRRFLFHFRSNKLVIESSICRVRNFALLSFYCFLWLFFTSLLMISLSMIDCVYFSFLLIVDAFIVSSFIMKLCVISIFFLSSISNFFECVLLLC